jgi:hypothetical protein
MAGRGAKSPRRHSRRARGIPPPAVASTRAIPPDFRIPPGAWTLSPPDLARGREGVAPGRRRRSRFRMARREGRRRSEESGGRVSVPATAIAEAVPSARGGAVIVISAPSPRGGVRSSPAARAVRTSTRWRRKSRNPLSSRRRGLDSAPREGASRGGPIAGT